MVQPIPCLWGDLAQMGFTPSAPSIMAVIMAHPDGRCRQHGRRILQGERSHNT